jgi:hypothetical protein
MSEINEIIPNRNRNSHNRIKFQKVNISKMWIFGTMDNISKFAM